MEHSRDEGPVEPEPRGQVKRSEPAPAFKAGTAPPGRLFPLLPPGAAVGLFGGSFDPAHEGHLAVSEAARRACGLRAVVWLVTPGNPLKPDQDYALLGTRVATARTLSRGRPWVRVSSVEDRLSTRYTSDTITALRARRPDLRFVWIMGADSLAGFHRWRDWRGIASRVPLLVISRPGYGLLALRSPAARALAASRRPAAAARTLPGARTPAWVYLPGLNRPESSTAIRALTTRPLHNPR